MFFVVPQHRCQCLQSSFTYNRSLPHSQDEYFSLCGSSVVFSLSELRRAVLGMIGHPGFRNEFFSIKKNNNNKKITFLGDCFQLYVLCGRKHHLFSTPTGFLLNVSMLLICFFIIAERFLLKFVLRLGTVSTI